MPFALTQIVSVSSIILFLKINKYGVIKKSLRENERDKSGNIQLLFSYLKITFLVTYFCVLMSHKSSSVRNNWFRLIIVTGLF